MAFISDYFNIGHKGHRNFDFVDVNLDSDNRLFIDPILIEMAAQENLLCRGMCGTIHAFADALYDTMRMGTLKGSSLLAHAQEINAAKLGYGNGSNGKGKTPGGLYESLHGFTLLAQNIDSFNQLQDILVFVPNFGEDNLSDLLLNVLHVFFSQFTAEQMNKLGIPPHRYGEVWYFSDVTCRWEQKVVPIWEYNGQELLLVPKYIVRKRYLCNVEHYLRHVILERQLQTPEYEKWAKKDLMANMRSEEPLWRYHHAAQYTKEHPDALDEYHTLLIPLYRNAKLPTMSDDELDQFIYGRNFNALLG